METEQAVRRFNRRWTEVLGLLERGLLDTEYSLPEARVIFELAQRAVWQRSELRDRLGMDASFLTRVLNRLREQDLVTLSQSEHDGRALDVALTQSGQEVYSMLDGRSAEQVGALLAPLSSDQQRVVGEALTTVTHLLSPAERTGEVMLRGLAPGDLGWVIGRNGSIYADEYGWNLDFEGLVARIVAEFHDGFTPGRERAWIAEVDGARAGCVFCCDRGDDVAQLRVLLVEPWARGLGVGTRLVDECIAFARAAGYRRMMLWTNDILTAARRIYERVGFTLVEEDNHHSFGRDLVGQNWELELG